MIPILRKLKGMAMPGVSEGVKLSYIEIVIYVADGSPRAV